MGYKHFDISMPTDYTDTLLKEEIKKLLGIDEFTFHIERKSLDARKKNDIHFKIHALVSSEAIAGPPISFPIPLEIPVRKNDKKAVILGCGPAGFFAAYVLQQSGYQTTLVERGLTVEKRAGNISAFEKTGVFNPLGNYLYGEGGAGTFSDGKLTARSKQLTAEKRYMLDTYVTAGAPEEILYLAHPHIGSDNFRPLVKRLREKYEGLGGIVLFDTTVIDIRIKDMHVTKVETGKGMIDCDIFIVASGHSAYDTYRMLLNRSVQFRTKSFAVGSRVEHPQEIINKAQWGKSALPGVKAAEYRLTSKVSADHPVYTFCMCPGGIIVPAGATNTTQVVNGMSNYLRNGKFANAGCVAALNLNTLMKKDVSPGEALEWVENLENRFFTFSGGFRAPGCRISDYISQKESGRAEETSYPFGFVPSPLWELFPLPVSSAIRRGLVEFSRKLRGFDQGLILGLESKTSSPIQVIREKDGRCLGFENLYMAGEGSGHSGGIISSGADGIKTALQILKSS